jgi:hypothetical protein
MQLVFSVFTPRSTFLLASVRVSLYLHGIYVTPQYVNIISIDQKLICSIQFQPHLLFFLPYGVF